MQPCVPDPYYAVFPSTMPWTACERAKEDHTGQWLVVNKAAGLVQKQNTKIVSILRGLSACVKRRWSGIKGLDEKHHVVHRNIKRITTFF